MMCGHVKSAKRLPRLAWAILMGVKDGLRLLVPIILRESKRIGLCGASKMNADYCLPDFVTPKTGTWQSRLARQAVNTPAHIIKLRERIHRTLDRGNCYD